jgi:hypothetical protein
VFLEACSASRALTSQYFSEATSKVQVLGRACLLNMVKIFDVFTSSKGLFCESYTVCIKDRFQ